MKKLHRLVVVLAVVLGIAAPAAAHNKIAPVTPATDLRYEIAAQERVQTLPVFAGTSAFDELAHIELPPPSIADELARRFAANDVEPSSELAIFSPTVSRKLALGPLGVFEENNVNQHSYLGRELHQGLGYVRNRWFDPTTGTWLSPDPKGYVDSSNLYAFAGGDPVNRRDPTGEDAYDDKLQGYIAWYSAQRGAMADARKRLGDAYRREVAGNNDVGMIVAEDNILATAEMAFGGGVENAALFLDYARLRGNRAALSMSFEQIHAEVVSDEAVKSMASAVVPLLHGVTQARIARQQPAVKFDNEVNIVTNAKGLPIVAEGTVTGPHPGRSKGYRPVPAGGLTRGDHRGHLIPEGGVDNQKLVNRRENFISEAPSSNLGPKKRFDLLASRVAAQNPNSLVRTRHEPLYRLGETRPYAVTHWILKDGVVVHGETVFNPMPAQRKAAKR